MNNFKKLWGELLKTFLIFSTLPVDSWMSKLKGREEMQLEWTARLMTPYQYAFLPIVSTTVTILALTFMCAGVWSEALHPLLISCMGSILTIILTGSMHQDAILDVMDSYFAGGSPEHRFKVMTDSTIGAVGVYYNIVSLNLTLTLLATTYYLIWTLPNGLGVLLGLQVGATSFLSRSKCAWVVVRFPDLFFKAYGPQESPKVRRNFLTVSRGLRVLDTVLIVSVVVLSYFLTNGSTKALWGISVSAGFQASFHWFVRRFATRLNDTFGFIYGDHLGFIIRVTEALSLFGLILIFSLLSKA